MDLIGGAPYLLDVIILWIHLFSAVIFVGGSFFMWIVVMPATKLVAKDEAERTLLVGRIAKQFGRLVTPLLVVLVLTGLYNATWYLPSFSSLFYTYDGLLLFIKSVLTTGLIVLIYIHNVYFGRKIVRMARERDVEGLKAVRRRSRVISMMNLVLMALILLVAVLMQSA
jgi:putative copper resistance protein D